MDLTVRFLLLGLLQLDTWLSCDSSFSGSDQRRVGHNIFLFTEFLFHRSHQWAAKVAYKKVINHL